MTDLKNKISAALINTVLFAATIALAGLGFALIGTLALFGVIAVGIAMIAAPFALKSQPTDTDAAV